ncbi:DUF1254 domain-containing protein [Labrys monachus]|uniref:Membrane protein n=1 Tax=Labrys monachus TaxID=217067 RepID=A0ABU0FIW7_9HYPH|nr:DUF1254 domain-containing protein [Labrys monachus]MDQ0394552.1 putative membrane protein [Labrys monachus]
MMRWLLWSVAGLLMGLAVHLITIIVLPGLGARSGFQRAAAVAPLGRFVVLTADKTPLPYPDPGVVTALCRYDLAAGAVRLHVPGGMSFVSVSLYTPDGLAYYSLTDRAAAGDAIDLTLFTPALLAETRSREGADTPGSLRVEAPQGNGMVSLRALVTEPGRLPEVERQLETATCATAAGG